MMMIVMSFEEEEWERIARTASWPHSARHATPSNSHVFFSVLYSHTARVGKPTPRLLAICVCSHSAVLYYGLMNRAC